MRSKFTDTFANRIVRIAESWNAISPKWRLPGRVARRGGGLPASRATERLPPSQSITSVSANDPKKGGVGELPARTGGGRRSSPVEEP